MCVIVKQWSGDITAWAPGGIREFPAKDFEAYRHIMPHSEYVSGTSCLFKSKEEYVISYTKNLGFTGAFPISVKPVGGESKVEITGNGFFPSSLESPTSPRQALLGCCMPQRAGEGSGARQKPKSTT